MKSEQHHIVKRHTLSVESVSSVLSISLPVWLSIHSFCIPFDAQYKSLLPLIGSRCCLEFTRISILRLNNFCRLSFFGQTAKDDMNSSCRSNIEFRTTVWKRMAICIWYRTYFLSKVSTYTRTDVFGQMGASSLHAWILLDRIKRCTKQQSRKVKECLKRRTARIDYMTVTDAHISISQKHI